MKEAIWSNPRDVRMALTRLGLTLEPLQDALRAGYLFRISRTENDAPSAPGFYQWNETLKMLREQLVAIGWERNNDSGFPTVVNRAMSLAISVSSGNENTGNPSAIPSTKYHKGPCTVDRVSSNAQIELDLYPDLPAPVRSSDGDSAFLTWTLLFYTDCDEIRAELSLPVLIDAGGQINAWKERIILPVIPLDGDGSKLTTEPDFGPDVDINIRRRA
ncbi:MAG TPA: hypothetical protein VN224_01305 [Xanthomonadales bacterium]|nr:hypothetical protein [Xanthomonadales bacterium]